MLFAPIAIMTLNEYSLLLLPSPKAWKKYLPQLVEAPLAAHALPRVVLLVGDFANYETFAESRI